MQKDTKMYSSISEAKTVLRNKIGQKMK